jgi:hypothetical protein
MGIDWREHMIEAVKKDGRDMKALSRAMGQGETFVRDMLKRGRKPNIEAVIALADVLGLTVGELVGVEPVMRSRARLVGYVGAGGAVYPPGDDVEWIEAPPGAPEGIEALEVKNGSMLPAYRDGDRLFIEPNDYDPAQIIGEECVVDLADGRRLLKVLRRGSEENRWNLESFNADLIENVEIAKAAPVGWVDKRRRRRTLQGVRTGAHG